MNRTNHVKEIVAIDFFAVPTAGFKVRVVLMVVAHRRRRGGSFQGDGAPDDAAGAPQIVEAFPRFSSSS